MKKILIYLMIFSLIFIGGSSIVFSQNIVLKYDFEEGLGSVALDTTGNNNNGVIVLGDYDLNEKFGSYSLRLDTSNSQEYINMILNAQNISSFCFGSWINSQQVYEDSVIFDAEYNSQIKYKFYFNNTGTYFQYRDNNSVLKTQTLNGQIPYNSYTHLMFCYNDSNKFYSYYVNGVQSSTGLLVGNGIKKFSTPTIFRIGAGLNTGNYQRQKYMDGIIVTDFILNTSQRTELINFNTLTLPVIEEEEEINNTEEISIITMISPLKDNSYIAPVNFQGQLTKKSNCDIYINNKKEITFSQLNTYNYDVFLPIGNHTYFIYCEYVENSTLFYELSNIINFEINSSPPSQITFVISGSDFNVNDANLFMVTPCISDIIGLGDLTKDVITNINKDKEFYFQKLVNGVASFDLQTGDYEFCLVNGQVQYNENDFTKEFNINKVDGVLNLGSFNLPSNVTNTYQIKTENLEIYGVTNPKAWGQTWSGIIGGLILLILGVLILYAGVKSENGKIVVAGAILCLSALGISGISFIGLLV